MDYVTPYKLDSLKVLGSVGEPINEEAYIGTMTTLKEIAQLLIHGGRPKPQYSDIALAGSINCLSYALPLPGVQPCLVDADGTEIEGNDVQGNLCMKFLGQACLEPLMATTTVASRFTSQPIQASLHM